MRSAIMARKGENIYKRKDGRWEARYIHHYENGKAKYRYLYGASYTEVKYKRLEEITRNEKINVSKIKRFAVFDEISNKWLNSRKNDIKESTYARYFSIINLYIIPTFKNQKLISINAEKHKKLYESLKSRLADKTVSDIMCVFKSIWKYGKENGYPCCEFTLPSVKVNHTRKINTMPPKTLEKVEFALMKDISTVNAGIILAQFAGIRIGEICGLKWGDIDFDNGFICIRRTVERIHNLDYRSQLKTKVVISTPKTDNSARIIPLPVFVMEYLEKLRKSDEKYVLTSSTKNTEPHAYYLRYKTFLRKNKIGDYTFHELRHTFATQCVEKGFDIKSLSEILGHADIKTTMNLYVHPTLQMKRKQMELLKLSGYSPSK